MRNEEQKKAHADYMRDYTRKNKDRINKRRREDRKTNPEKHAKWDKDRYARDPLGHKLQKYNITKEQYLQMEKEQDGNCAICNKEMSQPNIDHCHVTKEVRGLLCTACNTGIGKLKDDIDVLESAIRYLKKDIEFFGFEF